MSSKRYGTLSDYLRATRVRQAELADLVGVSPSAISCYVAGTRTPRLGVAVKLSRITGVPVERLLAHAANSNAQVA